MPGKEGRKEEEQMERRKDGMIERTEKKNERKTESTKERKEGRKEGRKGWRKEKEGTGGQREENMDGIEGITSGSALTPWTVAYSNQNNFTAYFQTKDEDSSNIFSLRDRVTSSTFIANPVIVCIIPPFDTTTEVFETPATGQRSSPLPCNSVNNLETIFRVKYKNSSSCITNFR